MSIVNCQQREKEVIDCRETIQTLGNMRRGNKKTFLKTEIERKNRTAVPAFKKTSLFTFFQELLKQLLHFENFKVYKVQNQ